MDLKNSDTCKRALEVKSKTKIFFIFKTIKNVIFSGYNNTIKLL
jgi:hypothetical protein